MKTNEKQTVEIKECEIPNSNLSYFVSSDGNSVFSRTRNGKMRSLKLQTRSDGYKFFNVVNNAERKTTGCYAGKFKNRTILMHNAVYGAFKNNGDYYSDRSIVINHIDGNTRNNNLSNLELITSGCNKLHGHRNSDKLSYIQYRESKNNGTRYAAYVGNVYLGTFGDEYEASKIVYNHLLRYSKEGIPRYARFHHDLNILNDNNVETSGNKYFEQIYNNNKK